MSGLNLATKHINQAIEATGDTIIARSRWLYDNEVLYGSVTEKWVSAAVSDGIKPYPRIAVFKKKRRSFLIFCGNGLMRLIMIMIMMRMLIFMVYKQRLLEKF